MVSKIKHRLSADERRDRRPLKLWDEAGCNNYNTSDDFASSAGQGGEAACSEEWMETPVE
jgi:hypothetical protein